MIGKRIIIAGGRDFEDYALLRRVAKRAIRKEDTIISGGAKGADALGERLAETNGLNLEVYPADWDKHGRGAGYIRNHQMSLIADMLIAFWDGRSKGTKNMIETAHKARIDTLVIYYPPNEK